MYNTLYRFALTSDHMTAVFEHGPYEPEVHVSAVSASKAFSIKSYPFQHFKPHACVFDRSVRTLSVMPCVVIVIPR